MDKYKSFLIVLAFLTLCVLRFVLLDSNHGVSYAVTLI